ncbi:hypothetical protein P775_02930 [Puniceibacterium antarcticum]|uniref:protein O-GlcNAc transferase n=2 Tax=Puniceibacterium antarcticum TaxID=1206336 RepID=A0A2G8RJA1_9RHOB|nr:hypothetical protein P775_02930 [Puniceibacterium antarcticum]
MGNAFQELKRFEEATTAYKNALAIEPNFFEAFFNMGAALRCNGELDAAVAAYKQAIAIQPDYVAAHNNLGTTLRLQNKTDAAITAFKRAIEIRPDYAEAYFNLGNAFQTQHKLDSAISAYESAILLKPKYAEVYNNMGAALQAKRELHAAQLALEFATRTSPDYAEAHCNLGSVLQEQGQFTEAINAFKRTLQIRPDHAVAEANLLHQKHQIGDWQAYDQLGSVCERLGITTNAVTGFTMLSKEDDPGRQLARAKAWVAENYTQSSIPIAARLDSLPRRLRIGYFSADFHDHPVLFLISGLLRNYSRDQFEVIAFSYGGPNESEMRKLVERNVDHFVEITQKENSDIVEMARGYELDIAIDLNGYTQNTRSDLFQFRLAPIQINYLGYPSTTGATFMDYMVADPISLPQSERKFYSENIIYMPDSWVPYDDCREISRCKTTPSDFGLPEDAFVFCCFNNSYKISPREFNIWMRILTNVPDSVLWLFSSNKWVEKNLRREAVVRNVDPERLIFAEKIPHAEYLARYRHADLFLDTFNFNAITTGSDALWAGLPIVTKSGRQFCARSTASLLNAVGLSELITETESEYEALILDLALDREKLSEIKNKLKKNLSVEPLFDTKRYTRNFENGLLQAYHLHFSGKRAEDIWVRSSPPQ